MADENRVIDTIIGAAGNAQRFHQGSHPQGGIPLDLTEAEEASLGLHRASIHAPEPRRRWGTDEDGEPIEVGPQGLVVTDPLTGATEPLTEESAARSEANHKKRAEQAEARWNAGAAGATPPPLPEPKRTASKQPPPAETPDSAPSTERTGARDRPSR